MVNKIKIGTFYTKNGLYEQISKNYLQKSLDKFSISPLITETSNYGNWTRNVAEKPKAILEQLGRLEEDECLVFLDADCTVEKWPTLFEEIPADYDIAYHTLSWKQWYGYATETLELLTGTMFFRNNDKVKKLCEHWYNESVKSRQWEQKVLQSIISSHNMTSYPLPLSYCYMNSRPGGIDPLHFIPEPHIIHYQKSREYKRRIK